MRKSVLVWAPLLFGSLAFGQLESNSITVTASRNASVQPDQAVFAVSVQAGIGTSLDDVVGALQGSGITAANLSGVASSIPYATTRNSLAAPTLEWAFSLTGPLTKTKDTVANLTALQQSIAKLNNGMTLSFNIVGTQVSQQLAQSQTCSITALVADATAQAQTLAAAGGLTLGAIVAMSSASSISSTQGFYSIGLYASVYSSPAIPPCTITLKFNTTRY